MFSPYNYPLISFSSSSVFSFIRFSSALLSTLSRRTGSVLEPRTLKRQFPNSMESPSILSVRWAWSLYFASIFSRTAAMFSTLELISPLHGNIFILWLTKSASPHWVCERSFATRSQGSMPESQ